MVTEKKTATTKKKTAARKKTRTPVHKTLHHRHPKRKAGDVHVYSMDGKKGKPQSLPQVFHTEIRADIIRLAVTAAQANRRQPYGPSPTGGQRHSVEWWGKGRGSARTPRLKDSARGAQSPNTVGGRRAHPPKVEHDWSKSINKKERTLARNGALAATAHKDIVRERGHKFDDAVTLPVVIDAKFAATKSTAELLTALEKIGVYDDLRRAKNGIHQRAGRGKMRSRRLRRPKSMLVILTEADGAYYGLRNLPGVDITTTKELSVEMLAPGGAPGRLTVISEEALKEMSKW